jgi:hypothetical protein
MHAAFELVVVILWFSLPVQLGIGVVALLTRRRPRRWRLIRASLVLLAVSTAVVLCLALFGPSPFRVLVVI